MEWINLHTSTIDSAEFATAEPQDLGTWLKLMRYCVGQENGGVIEGAKKWLARQWSYLVKVEAADVTRESQLWTWDGDDLTVEFYPTKRESEVRAKRKGGLKGLHTRWGKKRPVKSASNLLPPDSYATAPATTQPNSSPNGIAINIPHTEGEEEGEEEGNTPPACEGKLVIPTEAETLAWAKGHKEPTLGVVFVPPEWALGWLNWRLEKPHAFPQPWKADAARRFKADFESKHPKALGQKKNGTATAGRHIPPALKEL